MSEQAQDRIDIFLVKPSKVWFLYTTPPSTDPTNVEIVFEAADQQTGAGVSSNSSRRQDNAAQKSLALDAGATARTPSPRKTTVPSDPQSTSEASASQAGSVSCPETPPRLHPAPPAQKEPVHNFLLPPLPPPSPQEFLTAPRTPPEFFTGPSESPRTRNRAATMSMADRPMFQHVHVPTRLPGGAGTILVVPRGADQCAPSPGQDNAQTLGTPAVVGHGGDAVGHGEDSGQEMARAMAGNAEEVDVEVGPTTKRDRDADESIEPDRKRRALKRC
ncbi:hypothetical protein FA95DRAFT_1612784 [Auriscalpium vulgare]|uniref:Uncharacterized protein n=1 Tax=Auriscalpium vulgare TaxID=40419 RepID=A0ACB8R5K8_9AGAM|nr:hypothetical protein FA95DRAFT_1612784 [Auriscalpium vulgare]